MNIVIELTEEEIKVIRQGLMELPIKVALNTLSSLNEKIIQSQRNNMPVMAKRGE